MWLLHLAPSVQRFVLTSTITIVHILGNCQRRCFALFLSIWLKDTCFKQFSKDSLKMNPSVNIRNKSYECQYFNPLNFFFWKTANFCLFHLGTSFPPLLQPFFFFPNFVGNHYRIVANKIYPAQLSLDK